MKTPQQIRNEVEKEIKCIFCEWQPDLNNVEWGICYDCIDKCELDINQTKCKVFKKEV